MFLSEDRPGGRMYDMLAAGPSRFGLGYGRFLQADPVGYDDQLNLYEYVGDDPVNATDPTGLYACTGSLLCSSVTSANGAAIGRLTSTISTLNSVQDKLAAGKALNRSETQAVNTLQKYLGSEVTRSENLKQVIGVAKDELRVLRDPTGGVGFDNENKNRIATRYGNNSVTVHYPVFSRLSERDRVATMANESWHVARSSPHDYRNGGRELAAGRASDHPRQFGWLMMNHDNFNYGLGF